VNHSENKKQKHVQRVPLFNLFNVACNVWVTKRSSTNVQHVTDAKVVAVLRVNKFFLFRKIFRQSNQKITRLIPMLSIVSLLSITQSSGMACLCWFPSYHAKYKCSIPAATIVSIACSWASLLKRLPSQYKDAPLSPLLQLVRWRCQSGSSF
jgi:hypothetical protein